MSFKYIIQIKQGKSVVESTTTDTLAGAVDYADAASILGDLVVISEGYEGADGVLDSHDHVQSWYVD